MANKSKSCTCHLNKQDLKKTKTGNLRDVAAAYNNIGCLQAPNTPSRVFIVSSVLSPNNELAYGVTYAMVSFLAMVVVVHFWDKLPPLYTALQGLLLILTLVALIHNLQSFPKCS